jgi:hypothetical protein
MERVDLGTGCESGGPIFSCTQNQAIHYIPRYIDIYIQYRDIKIYIDIYSCIYSIYSYICIWVPIIGK